MQKIFLPALIILSLNSFAQSIHGSVFNEHGDILPYSSIFVKGGTQGVTANGEGRYNISLPPGTYTLVCQHVGYTKQERKITLQKSYEEIIFILPEQKLQLKEVIIKSGDEDPAYEIIRQAIKKRSFYNKQVKAFTCEAYIKGLIKLRNLPDRILGKKVPDEDRKDMRLDSSGKGIIFLSESITKVAVQQPGKVKLEVISGRQSGGDGFGFNFPTFINLYENNVTMFTSRINPRGFISPISDNALNYYRYKFLGSFFEDGKEINTIRVIPKRGYEPVFSGIINISDGDWRIHSCDLLLTKTSQLELIDSLQLTQIYAPVSNNVWRIKNQLTHFNFKQLGIDAIGNFVNVYSKYDLDPKFSKNYFDRVVIKYDTSVNKKAPAYWDSIRPVPLEPEEIKDYKVKDSLYKTEKDSALSKSNIDSLKKKQGKVTLKQIFQSGINRTHYSKTNPYTYHIEPVLQSVQFTSVEGVVVNFDGDYQKYLKGWKTNLTVNPNIRYGFNNNELNAWIGINFRTRDIGDDKKLKREEWDIAGGRRVSQFNKESDLSAIGNTFRTLIRGENYLKIYENYFGDLSYTKRFEDGFRIKIEGLYENRSPLENTTDFVIISKDKKNLTPNYPTEVMTSNFSAHQAFVVSVDISVKPGQRYIQFPHNKFAIGSKYPTFEINYTKGIKNIFGSDEDFDKWKFSVYDNVNLKLLGSIKYKAIIGGFLNTNSVYIQDYQHFNGNLSHVAREYVNTYQLASYYAFSNTSSFYTSLFFEHHFNGLLTNKIPLFKKLNWNLVDGTNALYINKNTQYAEVFAGIENIFKFLRFDVVAGVRNGERVKVDYRIGFGGSIGGGFNPSRSRSRRPGF